ncbi:hypothetical protein M0R45_036034 [Rubus argutus]|uniref:Uncharacterized protein n=1 Tax=Rubus argutus TaxID=59490 RepID=A0AAW1VYL9_RUBAR
MTTLDAAGLGLEMVATATRRRREREQRLVLSASARRGEHGLTLRAATAMESMGLRRREISREGAGGLGRVARADHGVVGNRARAGHLEGSSFVVEIGLGLKADHDVQGGLGSRGQTTSTVAELEEEHGLGEQTPVMEARWQRWRLSLGWARIKEAVVCGECGLTGSSVIN